MAPQLAPLERQVVVVTGGSSGIGLATALAAARRGARVVIASRSAAELEAAAARIAERGGTVRTVVADVAREEDVRRIADVALEAFGRVDTWVNNAGVSFYGRLADAPVEDMRRVFDVNFWGVVHGSRTAVPLLREAGGAIINVGSVLSDVPVPLQGAYVASKHAVKGFTDSLRMELEAERAPISVTLVKPSAIDTPYYAHARNYMEVEPRPPGPVYAPEVVAAAILRAAEQPVREVTVGGGGRLLSAVRGAMPRIADRVIEHALHAAQRTDRPKDPTAPDNLHTPAPPRAEVRGGHRGRVRRSSVYTDVASRPGAAWIAAGVAVVAFLAVRVLGETRG